MENNGKLVSEGSNSAGPETSIEDDVIDSGLIVDSPYEYVYGGDTYEDNWCS